MLVNINIQIIYNYERKYVYAKKSHISRKNIDNTITYFNFDHRIIN